MSEIELFKIGGLAGLITGFFYLIAKLIVNKTDGMSNRHKMTIIVIILLMAFSLSSFGMYIFYKKEFREDGGRMSYDRAWNVAAPYTAVRLAHPYRLYAPCSDIKTGVFSLWLSFNDDKPYYIVHEEGKDLRVALLSMQNNEATFVVNTPQKKIATGRLAPEQSVMFTWNNCRCRLTYLGKKNMQTSFRYLWRERQTAEYKLEVL